MQKYLLVVASHMFSHMRKLTSVPGSINPWTIDTKARKPGMQHFGCVLPRKCEASKYYYRQAGRSPSGHKLATNTVDKKQRKSQISPTCITTETHHPKNVQKEQANPLVEVASVIDNNGKTRKNTPCQELTAYLPFDPFQGPLEGQIFPT